MSELQPIDGYELAAEMLLIELRIMAENVADSSDLDDHPTLMAMNVSLRGALRAAVFWLCPNLDGADPIESMMLLREQIVAQQVISTAVTNWCVFNGGLGLSSDE